MFWTGLRKNFAAVKTEENISSVEVFRFVEGSREENVTKDIRCILYSVVSLVVPRLEEAPVLKKISKVPSILEQKGHRYPSKHSSVSYVSLLPQVFKYMDGDEQPSPPLGSQAATVEFWPRRKDPRCKLCSFWSNIC